MDANNPATAAWRHLLTTIDRHHRGKRQGKPVSPVDASKSPEERAWRYAVMMESDDETIGWPLG